jgi:plastocyanin
MDSPRFLSHQSHRLPAAVLAGVAGVLLGMTSCGGGSASPPSGGVPGLSSSAKPSTSSPAPVSTVVGASIVAKPSAAASGQAAPGPYTANGNTSVTNGQATIQALDTLKWQPNTIAAKPGDKVALTVNNTGNTAHNFISPTLGVASGQDIATGKTTTVNFSAPSQPGTYQFWCNIPGHAEAGMVGEVIVQ